MSTKSSNPHWDRRDFLRCSSFSLALPFLGSLKNGVAAEAAKKAPETKHAKRFVAVGYHLGLYKRSLFPAGAVKSGVQDPKNILRQVVLDAGLKDDFTTFSGLDHQGINGKGHAKIQTFLTGKLSSGISLDQLIANKIGKGTRFKSLILAAGSITAKASLAFTERGLPYPVIMSPQVIFDQLFGTNATMRKTEGYYVGSGKSLLDRFTADANSLTKGLNGTDRHKLKEYFHSIREVEKGLERQAGWQGKPYPAVDPNFKMPEKESLASAMLLQNEDLMVDLIALALKNDSTRVATLTIPSAGAALYFDENNLSMPYHAASHFGGSSSKVQALIAIQKRHLQALARMTKALKDAKDHNGESLLDSTVVLAGSAMGESTNHTRRNFPVFVAGGGFDHQQHIYCNTPEIKNVMLCDLYVTLLRRFGIHVDLFGVSKSNLNGVFTV